MDPNPILCYPFSCEFSIPPDLCRFLFDTTQAISLTMTICSWLWVDFSSLYLTVFHRYCNL
ncbi:hypothetical protein BDB01DRAFT_806031 [Pilobolus umbonatus]|nr:hypothetical protein BDB01DRAFT_806031 [Pilobolus umbonatus]